MNVSPDSQASSPLEMATMATWQALDALALHLSSPVVDKPPTKLKMTLTCVTLHLEVLDAREIHGKSAICTKLYGHKGEGVSEMWHVVTARL